MSARYGLRFGGGNPQDYAGLTPSFIVFKNQTGSDVASPPAITEVGTSTGLYYFTYTPNASFTVFFTVDGGAGIGTTSDRYITGTLDPIANVDQQVGFSADTYGTTALPSTVFGFVQRAVQLFQSDATFNKSTGVWATYAKGTSTMLVSKTLGNSTTQVTKV